LETGLSKSQVFNKCTGVFKAAFLK